MGHSSSSISGSNSSSKSSHQHSLTIITFSHRHGVLTAQISQPGHAPVKLQTQRGGITSRGTAVHRLTPTFESPGSTTSSANNTRPSSSTASASSSTSSLSASPAPSAARPSTSHSHRFIPFSSSNSHSRSSSRSRSRSRSASRHDRSISTSTTVRHGHSDSAATITQLSHSALSSIPLFRHGHSRSTSSALTPGIPVRTEPTGPPTVAWIRYANTHCHKGELAFAGADPTAPATACPTTGIWAEGGSWAAKRGERTYVFTLPALNGTGRWCRYDLNNETLIMFEDEDSGHHHSHLHLHQQGQRGRYDADNRRPSQPYQQQQHYDYQHQRSYSLDQHSHPPKTPLPPPLHHQSRPVILLARDDPDGRPALLVDGRLNPTEVEQLAVAAMAVTLLEHGEQIWLAGAVRKAASEDPDEDDDMHLQPHDIPHRPHRQNDRRGSPAGMATKLTPPAPNFSRNGFGGHSTSRSLNGHGYNYGHGHSQSLGIGRGDGTGHGHGYSQSLGNGVGRGAGAGVGAGIGAEPAASSGGAGPGRGMGTGIGMNMDMGMMMMTTNEKSRQLDRNQKTVSGFINALLQDVEIQNQGQSQGQNQNQNQFQYQAQYQNHYQTTDQVHPQGHF